MIECVQHALEVAEDRGTEDLLAFATSALREAPNGPEVLAAVRDETGVDLEVLTGNDEARLTFLAVRRWFGWSSGRLLVIDIGGGSLELAAGIDEVPDAVASLPLGAGRLTRTMLPGDPPSGPTSRRCASTCGPQVAGSCARSRRSASADHVVGTSKTFKQLARLAGAPASEEGERVPRLLRLADLDKWVPKLAAMTVRRARRAARRLDRPGPAAARRRHRGRGRDGAARGRRGAGLPLGAARGHHPAPARLDAGPDELTHRLDGMQRTVRVPGAKVALSTASCYPETCTTAFEMAADLGFDGVEVMVWTDPVSQDPDALRGLSDRFGVPVLAIHAPCLLLTQRVWSTDPWTKLQRAQAAAERVGAADRRRAPAVPLAAGVRPRVRRRVCTGCRTRPT